MGDIGKFLVGTLIAAVLALGPVRAIALEATSGDRVLRVELRDLSLDFVNQKTGESVITWELGEAPTAIALDVKGDVIYLGYADGIVEAVEIATLQAQWFLRFFGDPVFALSVGGDDLIVVNEDGGAAIVNAMTGESRPDSPRDMPASLPSPIVSVELFDRYANLRLGNGAFLEYNRIQKRWGTPLLPPPPPPYVPPPPPPPYVVEAPYIAPPPPGTAQYVAPPPPAPPYVAPPPISDTLAKGRFPWPPPPYSDVHVIDGYQLAASELRTYEDVARRIKEALADGRYTTPRYYLIDDGFVVVTQIEEIDESGYPVDPEYERWWNGEAPQPNPFTFSLTAFLDALSSAPVGRYRIIAFALNVGECVSPPCTRPPAMDAADALLLAGGGEPALPNDIRNDLILPGEHRLSVLVYAFEKQNKTLPATLVRGGLPALTHLRAANILAALP